MTSVEVKLLSNSAKIIQCQRELGVAGGPTSTEAATELPSPCIGAQQKRENHLNVKLLRHNFQNLEEACYTNHFLSKLLTR